MTTSISMHPSTSLLSGDLAILAYFFNRFDSHQGQSDSKDTLGSQALFASLYLLTAQALNEGHTLYTLDTNKTSDEMADVPLFLSRLINDMGAYLQKLDITLDFSVQFIERCQLLLKQQRTHSYESKSIAHNIKEHISFLIQLEEMPEHLTTLSVLLAYFFRCICYIDWHFGTLKALYDYLTTHPFFMTMSSALQADKHYPKPLLLSGLSPSGFGVWLYRLWQAEYCIVIHIKKLLNQSHLVPDFALEDLNEAQQSAIVGAIKYNFAMITGGPGTGKTYTVARLVRVLLQKNQALKLVLVAPTGKAAKRMQESLAMSLAQDMGRLPQAMTVHRLLGIGSQATPKYYKTNPIPYDVIIVDEASMLGVELTAKLVSAIKSSSRLILLGDSHQLAAVEAGSVLGDLCSTPALLPYHHQLKESKRFDDTSAIGQLAFWTNQISPKSFAKLDALLTSFNDKLSLIDTQQHTQAQIEAEICQGFVPFIMACERIKHQPKDEKTLSKLFEQLNQFRVLTAGHQGRLSDTQLNEKIANFHRHPQTTSQKTNKSNTWYHGRVVMMTKNSYELGLYNGDTGICLEDNGVLKVYFEQHTTGFMPVMLHDELVLTAYAITIHKSQGSEFERVAICLDDTQTRLLTKELIYTAITRAKDSLVIYSSPKVLMMAVNTPMARQTGLPLLFESLH